MNCLDYFKQLCSVPHGSGNTKQVSDLLFSFCKEHGCECIQDELGNVIAYKAGSRGREEEAPVILQAHMDMVCVADEGVSKDFETEPIKLKEDGEYIWAEGTSLGADDGIGAAMIMAVIAGEGCDDSQTSGEMTSQKSGEADSQKPGMTDGQTFGEMADDKSGDAYNESGAKADTQVCGISHPPIEAVFTVDEETSMSGARGLDMSLLKGKRLINLDDECEGAINVGCAGGERIDIVIPYLMETVGDDHVFYRINISGLMGGHSGCDITEHRANGARLLARIFYGLSLKTSLKLCEFKAGRADNVIPPFAEAVVAVPEESAEEFERLTLKHEKLFKYEYANEAGLKIDVKRCERSQLAVIPKQSKAMMRFLSSMPDGMRKMSEDFPDIAQTSSNAGLITLKEDGFHIRILLRSSVPEEQAELKDMIIKMAEHDGGKVIEEDSYPAWIFRKNSPLRNTATETYREMTGMEPLIKSTHGGLEVGIFDSKIEGLDSIAMGPTITDIHSPREKMEIGSAIRCYQWLTKILERI